MLGIKGDLLPNSRHSDSWDVRISK